MRIPSLAAPLLLLSCSASIQDPVDLTVIDADAHMVDLVDLPSAQVDSFPTHLDVLVHDGDDPCEPDGGVVILRASGLRPRDYPISLNDPRFETTNNDAGSLDEAGLVGVWGYRSNVLGANRHHPAWMVTYQTGDLGSVRSLQDCVD